MKTLALLFVLAVPSFASAQTRIAFTTDRQAFEHAAQKQRDRAVKDL